MMKKLTKTLAIILACLCGAVASACSCSNTPDDPTPEQKKTQLAAPANVIVSDEYSLTFDAVENATSYQISIDDGDYIDIGNVTTYDLSKKYGAEVSVRAIGDENACINSKEVYARLDNYSQLFTGFEGAVGVDEWTGAVTGNSAQILGTTNEKHYSGENSLKVFMQPKVPGGNSYGGLMFDTGWYTIGNAIDWANVKELSVAFYIDTLSDEIKTLCEQYGATYNEEIKNVDKVFGVDAAGEFYVFYANEQVGEDKVFLGPAYNGVEFSVNEWHVQTVDVTEYATITDIQLLASNSQRAFGLSNEWSVASPYSYLLYWDDIKVSYKTILLEQPTNIAYSDGTFTWDEVEYASGYEVSVDGGVNWTKVNKTEYSANIADVTKFSVRAVNGKKYADGTARCEASIPAIYHATPRTQVTLDGTYALDISNENEVLKISDLDGDVECIKIGEKSYLATYDKTSGSIKASISGVTTGKEVTVKITTSTKIYTLTAKTWDKVISNATELQSLLDIFNAVTSEPNSANYTKGSFCLDADIDATSVTSTTNKAVFVGTIDGQGHTISNLTAPQGGIICTFTTTGKFCNIAFKNCSGTESFFADVFAGALSNVYAEVTITPKNSRYGLIRRMKEYNTSDKIRIENCVFIVNKATTAGSEVGGIVAKCDPDKNVVADIFKNVYLINNTESKFVSDGTNEKDLSSATTLKTYTSQTTFAGEEITFSADDGWATYWKLENGKLFFGNTQMI